MDYPQLYFLVEYYIFLIFTNIYENKIDYQNLKCIQNNKEFIVKINNDNYLDWIVARAFNKQDALAIADLSDSGLVDYDNYVCEICGKGEMAGMNVSHSHLKTKRTWKPNIQRVRAVVNGEVKRVNVCTRCLRSGKIQRAI